MAGKTKVSVTVQTDLLQEVNDLAGSMSRSAVFEQALASWVRRRRQVELDRAIEDYYRDLTGSEQVEDETWAKLGDETVTRSWDEPNR